MLPDEKFNYLVNKLKDILNIRPKEAMVYLALYRLGNQTVSVLAKHLGFNRTTINSVLENLCEKHLVKKLEQFALLCKKYFQYYLIH